MLVDLRDLHDNPMRDFFIDPVNDAAVEALKVSIEDDGFWGGIVCRQTHDGILQIAAGHHRVRAAIAAGVTMADVYVTEDMDDATMVRVYARENATQRGTTSTALAGTIASAWRLLTKVALTDANAGEFSSIRRNTKEKVKTNIMEGEGIGREVLLGFLAGIPGINEYSIKQQLANLKASGDCARIMVEIDEEIRHEQEELEARLREAEQEKARLQEQQRAAEARMQAAEAAKREADAQAEAAKHEVEEKRKVAAMQAAELAKRRAEEEAILAKKRAEENREAMARFAAMKQPTQEEVREKELIVERSRKATETAQKVERTFDFEGVSKYLTTAHQVQVFRHTVTNDGLKGVLPVEAQADLAQAIVAAAKNTGRHLSGEYIREYIETLYAKEMGILRVETRRSAEQDTAPGDDIIRQIIALQEEFIRDARKMAEHGTRISELLNKLPSSHPPIPIDADFRGTLNAARRALDTLSKIL